MDLSHTTTRIDYVLLTRDSMSSNSTRTDLCFGIEDTLTYIDDEKTPTIVDCQMHPLTDAVNESSQNENIASFSLQREHCLDDQSIHRAFSVDWLRRCFTFAQQLSEYSYDVDEVELFVRKNRLKDSLDIDEDTNKELKDGDGNPQRKEHLSPMNDDSLQHRDDRVRFTDLMTVTNEIIHSLVKDAQNGQRNLKIYILPRQPIYTDPIVIASHPISNISLQRQHKNKKRGLQSLFGSCPMTEQEMETLNQLFKTGKSDVMKGAIFELKKRGLSFKKTMIVDQSVATFRMFATQILTTKYKWTQDKIRAILSHPKVRSNIHRRIARAYNHKARHVKEQESPESFFEKILQQPNPMSWLHESEQISHIHIQDDSGKEMPSDVDCRVVIELSSGQEVSASDEMEEIEDSTKIESDCPPPSIDKVVWMPYRQATDLISNYRRLRRVSDVQQDYFTLADEEKRDYLERELTRFRVTTNSDKIEEMQLQLLTVLIDSRILFQEKESKTFCFLKVDITP
eukprot:TRINITY_DN8439_c0_g1_i1.p1 TRINITY_DN8439_c0_g1~~TRINITY_DN8439_c0_g1_i1.p1  ORF type:complete len:512 (+),score=114.89 TRINITY_DN8439_c0_g1_i1:111-1646(+)